MADPWDAVCRHIDGMAIGSTMAALSGRGVLRMLAAADRTGFGELRAAAGANAGFLHVALRLLADQGWLTCSGEAGTDELELTPTARGHVVMTALAEGYRAAARFLPLAGRIEEILQGARALGPFIALARAQWGLPAEGVPPDVRRQVLSHLNGHLIAPVMFALTRGTPPVTGPAAEILALAGWARDPELTTALRLAPQYRYPMVYLPLLRSVPELIFGDPRLKAETHLDRALDIRFSGEVFAALCRAPFLEIALPLFDREPVAEQPALVVDTGCGDGTLLATLHEAVRTRTARGRLLAEHPLLMVGADPSPVARRAAAARLAAAGVPHLVMDGDIADPGGLARALGAMGHDARDALHVCKSAIHDRGYAEPPPGPAPLVATNACARPDGTAIAATDMSRNLAGLFRSWLPLARRHGWIVIEAHTLPAQKAAALIGRTLATALDATHGYSCQYPTEPEVFAWAAGAGGFSSRRHAEPAAAALGHALLTIDHFVVGP